MASKTAEITDFLLGTDIAGDGDSLELLRRYNAAKAAVNGNRCATTDRRLAAIRAALRPFVIVVTVQRGSDIRLYNPRIGAELILEC